MVDNEYPFIDGLPINNSMVIFYGKLLVITCHNQMVIEHTQTFPRNFSMANIPGHL